MLWYLLVGYLSIVSSQGCSDPNCELCESSSGSEECLSCINNLFPSGPYCKKCEIQPLDCIISESISCFCKSTFSVSKYNLAPSSTIHCLNGQTCQVCFNGFYLISGSCSPCLTGCESCQDLMTCTQCSSYLTLRGGLCCDANCLACTVDGCLFCQDGYIPNGSVCEDIKSQSSRHLQGVDNCKVLYPDNKNACKRCNDGFYLSANLCNACNSRCKTCDWPEVCTSCNSPYKLISGYCCDQNCLSCKFEKCWLCVEGLLLKDGTCLTCPATCQSCKNGQCINNPNPANCQETDNLGKCIRCSSGFFLTNKACSPCSATCKTCDSPNQCTSCNSPLTLIQNSCCNSKCNLCVSGTCYRCYDDYLLSNNDCINCPNNCVSCTQGSCTQWVCPDNCEDCSDGSCNRCKIGFYYSNGKCSQCNSRCSACSAAEVCSACNSPYYLNSGYCCDSNCASCKFDICWVCKPGYLKKNNACLDCPSICGGCPNNICQTVPSCPSNCENCDDFGVCSRCALGYYLSTNSCERCNSQCESCIASQLCTKCNSGYLLIQGYCCPDGCSSCNHNKCWGCVDGYLYDGNNCVACPNNCLPCIGGVCTSSPNIECFKNCLSCSSPNWCDKCEDGYYPVTGGCSKCSYRCSKCDWYEVCTECFSEFHLVNGYCCPPGCSSCNLNTCWGCVDGLTLKDGQCS